MDMVIRALIILHQIDSSPINQIGDNTMQLSNFILHHGTNRSMNIIAQDLAQATQAYQACVILFAVTATYGDLLGLAPSCGLHFIESPQTHTDDMIVVVDQERLDNLVPPKLAFTQKQAD